MRNDSSLGTPGQKFVVNNDHLRKWKASGILERLVSSRFARRAYLASQSVPLMGPLLHRSLSSILPKGERIWTRIPKGHGKGLWILVDPRFDPDYLTGEHELWVQDLLAAHLQPGRCFYDVGAHIGFFSLIAGRLVGSSGSVTAFEPDPTNVEVLRANARRNQMAQLNAVEVAVWNFQGELSFKRSDSDSSGMEGHLIEQAPDSNRVVTVNTISLDDYLYTGVPQRPPHVLKVDVEGGESQVLAGATQTLRRFQPRLLCEVHDITVVSKLKNFLERFNYVSTEHPSGTKSYLWAEPRR